MRIAIACLDFILSMISCPCPSPSLISTSSHHPHSHPHPHLIQPASQAVYTERTKAEKVDGDSDGSIVVRTGKI